MHLPSIQSDASHDDRGFGGRVSPLPSPPAYSHSRPPPSGYRIPLSTDVPFPATVQAGHAPCVDGNGAWPVYFGSALFPNAVHPCKIVPDLGATPCRVPYGGSETEHRGRYDLLPFTDDMELIPASNGHIPPGRRPVEGGYEETGNKLYHAVATINGVRVPGKCGEHLSGANVAYGNAEIYARNYELLVWKH
ncbi:hypothetical protein M0805_002361 [Coniferiporia weirii]|nr:hypothetical protein M0805_002361 [Coniferiporia weirii]